MTKRQKAKQLNHLFNVLVIVIDTVVFVRVLFNYALTINGNWDDINAPTLMIFTSASIVALFLSLLNNTHYKGHPSYVLASVLVLGLSAIFFMYVLLAVSFTQILGA